MPDQIFISYRRGDSAYVTGHINDLLRKEFGSEAVFTDVDNIALGVDFRAVLDETVSQCQVLLAVIGTDWISAKDQDGNPRLHDPADFVRIEIESALNRNIPVVPLLVGGARMPLAEELPGTLKGLAFRNGTPIRPAPDFNTDMARLIKFLRTQFDSVRGAGSSSTVRKEPELGSAPAATKAPAGSKDGAKSGMHVAADESARKRAELGIEQNPKKRSAGLWMGLAVGLVIGSWYFAEQNPDTVQSILQTVNPDQAAQSDVENSSAEPVAEADEPNSAEPAESPALAIDPGEEVILQSDSGATVAISEATDPTDAQINALDPESAADVDEAADMAMTVADEAPQTAAAQIDEADVAADSTIDNVPTEIAKSAPENAGDIGEMVETPESLRGAGVTGTIRDGVSLAAVGDHEEAIQIFDVAIQRDPESSFAYKQRAASYQALGQYESALADYGRAIELNREDVNAFYNRGASHMALQDYAAAVADYDSVIQLDPEFVEAYSKRADAHEANGDTEAALRDRAVVTVFESNRED